MSMQRLIDAAPKATVSGDSANGPGIRGQFAPGSTGRDDMGIDHPSIVTARKVDMPVTEEYKKLMTRIMNLATKDGFKNTLSVTSSVSNEGKSITAVNLAVSLAQGYDHAVILIDADMRRPTLHAYLNRKPGRGLSDCLLSGMDPEAALMPIGSKKLTLLPAGKKIDDPVEFFASRKMQALMKDLKARYADRYIIIDTPPALLFAETKMISSFCDGTLLVVREGSATLDNISEALDILKETNVLGIVYNNAGMQNHTESSYYQYYSRYSTQQKT